MYSPGLRAGAEWMAVHSRGERGRRPGTKPETRRAPQTAVCMGSIWAHPGR